MKRIFATFFMTVILFCFQANAQSFSRYQIEEPWSISISSGPTQYFGELYSLWKYNEGVQPDYNFSLSGRYTFGTNLKARMDFTFYQISGDDRSADPKSGRIERNLNFRARNLEGAFLIEYYINPVKLYNRSRYFWNPYVFLGLGFSSNNPYGNYKNVWIPLRNLKTEGNAYPGTIITFPMGIGIKYKLNAYVDLLIEANYRFTNTDYLDDISAYNISEFYEELVNDYRIINQDGSISAGPNQMRLTMAVRNTQFLLNEGTPDVDAIVKDGGRIRRGSGLDVRKDGFMTLNVGTEIYLAHDLWHNIFAFNPRKRSYRDW